MIGEVLAEADEETYHRLASLVNGETITTYIDTGVIYPQIKRIRQRFTVSFWLQDI